ncbi:LOW QUALITY PROTEIN: hypothetical protein ACHAXN_010526 [Cyclotella atomus]
MHATLTSGSVPETVDGWRKVNADGVSILPAKCFVACNQFYIPSLNAVELDSFDLLRRDVKAKGHGIAPMGEEEPTYMSCTIWRDRKAFEDWKNGNAFKEAHGGGAAGDEEKVQQQEKPKPLWSKPPVPVFYEVTLVISSPEGS